ncbi:MAG: hypothetical protein JJ891_16760 [Rhizobiaceae bacterium]|nr:hypothetical protein [Rhizobiaceae bacterium]
MNLKECLASAVEQGALNGRQAEELLAYFNERFQKKRKTMSEAEATAAAKAEVSKELRAKAARDAANALLAEKVRRDLLPVLTNNPNAQNRSGIGKRVTADPLDAALSLLSNYGLKGVRSLEGRTSAIQAMAHRDLAEVMHHFRKSKVLARQTNKVDLENLVRALDGQNVNNPAVAAFATAVENVREGMRQRFNRAGGNMPKREGFDLNHTHNRRKMLKLDKDKLKAREKWKDFIRPLVNPDLMTDPRTGDAVGAAGLDDALDYSWESITSDGWAHHNPQARKFGSGSISNKYQDARFLQFRDADAWLAYNRKFGESDVISNIFNHVNMMASDIAALEQFGPNPEGTIEWMKQVVRKEIGKAQSGVSDQVYSMVGLDAGQGAEYRIDALWQRLRGQPTVWGRPAKLAADARNIASSAYLGATGILAGATDPFISASARYLAGLPVMSTANSMLLQMARDINTGTGKRDAAKRAIIWDDYLHTMHQEARFVDQMFGHEWSKYLVDRALTINGLKPMTAARKRLEAATWHAELGKLAEQGTDWKALDQRMQNALGSFGIDAAGWHKMRTAVDDAGFLDPGSVLDKTGDRQLAETYAELINQWNERSVPSGDPRVKSFLTGQTERGTIAGEAMQFGSQFLGFGMSFTARQMEATYAVSMLARSKPGQVAKGATYFAAMSTSLMVGAAIYEQIKAVLDGKDPVPMDQAFWAKAFIKGGGGGLFADFVERTENRFGGSFTETIPGPGVALIADTLDLTVANAFRLVRGDFDDDPATEKDEAFNAGRQVTNYFGRNTPVLSSHPATRLAYRRLFLDNLQYLADPKAHQSFAAKARKQPYFWEPGKAEPSRGIDFGPATENLRGFGN